MIRNLSIYIYLSIEKSAFKTFAKFTGKHLCHSLFFNKVAGVRPMAQVFSDEFWEIFKNTFFTEHLWRTASIYALSRSCTLLPTLFWH